MEIGLMLEEVQVAPSESFRIVGLPLVSAHRTRESRATWKVRINVPLSRLDHKATSTHQPGRHNTESGLEEFIFFNSCATSPYAFSHSNRLSPQPTTDSEEPFSLGAAGVRLLRF